MIVYHKGAAPNAAVMAQLLAPGGSSSQLLQTLTTTADGSGSWEFGGDNELVGQDVARIKFGQPGTVWQISEPLPSGALAVWTVVVAPGTTGQASSVVFLPTTTVSPVASSQTGSQVLMLATAGAPTVGSYAPGTTVFDSHGVAWYTAAGGNPPSDWTQVTPASELGYLLSTTNVTNLSSTTFAALTGITKTVTVPNNGRPVYIEASLSIQVTAALALTLDVTEDGTSVTGGAGVGVTSFTGAGEFQQVPIPPIRRTPAAGSHTYAVLYKVSGSNFALSNFSQPSTLTVTQR